MINRLFSKALALGLGLVSLAWFAAAGAAPQTDDVPYAADLAQEAQVSQAGPAPLLILFTAPKCAYCEQVRREFLIPMLRNPEYANKVIIRQVEMQGNIKLLDFTGKSTTHGQFAKQQRVMLTPTVKLFDANGNLLTEPLVGLTTPDFYGAYLDRAIDEARAKIRSQARP